MTVRRLPVYILADISGSMAGENIEAVNQGLRLLHNELLADPQASESAYLSVISFSSSAQQVVPLSEVAAFQPPTFQAGGATDLGEALQVLMRALASEVRMTTATTKGDWRPLVFVFSDGAPTDDTWEARAAELRRRFSCNIIALAVGADAEPGPLKQLTPNVMRVADDPSKLREFFKFVSASVRLTSLRAPQQVDPNAGLTLPPPPQGFTIVP